MKTHTTDISCDGIFGQTCPGSNVISGEPAGSSSLAVHAVESEAKAHGWAHVDYDRWLCVRCAKKLETVSGEAA